MRGCDGLPAVERGVRAAVIGLLSIVAGDGLCRAQTVAPAPTAPTSSVPFVQVGGEVPRPFILGGEELLKLPRAAVHAKDRDGKEVTFSGVPLFEVLQAAGLKFDPATMPSRGAVAAYVVIEAKDGYRAVFALAEIDPTEASQTILLAEDKDGQPLSPQEGPWRIVAPSDKRPARWVRQVTAISVHQG
jgi:DMSO/TMAO reductase YedYZ molybdopterin-dependent catalytic subunit